PLFTDLSYVFFRARLSRLHLDACTQHEHDSTEHKTCLHHFLPHLFGDITNISSLPFLPAAHRRGTRCGRMSSGHAPAASGPQSATTSTAPQSSKIKSRRFSL